MFTERKEGIIPEVVLCIKENWQDISAIFWPDDEWKDDWRQSEPHAAENLLFSLGVLTLLLNRPFPNFCLSSFSNFKTLSREARLSEVIGLVFTTFIYRSFFSNPPSYRPSQSVSSLAKAFGCSSLSCFCYRNALPTFTTYAFSHRGILSASPYCLRFHISVTFLP